MKLSLSVFYLILMVGIAITSCQPSYMDDTEDIETSTIEFKDLTASRDSACMFDTIILIADVAGDNLKYEWQRAKGTLVPVKGEPSKAYFWGCPTCVGRLTVSCTVSNDYGSYTKDVNVFVWPWTEKSGRFPGWERYIDIYGQW